MCGNCNTCSYGFHVTNLYLFIFRQHKFFASQHSRNMNRNVLIIERIYKRWIRSKQTKYKTKTNKTRSTNTGIRQFSSDLRKWPAATSPQLQGYSPGWGRKTSLYKCCFWIFEPVQESEISQIKRRLSEVQCLAKWIQLNRATDHDEQNQSCAQLLHFQNLTLIINKHVKPTHYLRFLFYAGT